METGKWYLFFHPYQWILIKKLRKFKEIKRNLIKVLSENKFWKLKNCGFAKKKFIWIFMWIFY